MTKRYIAPGNTPVDVTTVPEAVKRVLGYDRSDRKTCDAIIVGNDVTFDPFAALVEEPDEYGTDSVGLAGVLCEEPARYIVDRKHACRKHLVHAVDDDSGHWECDMVAVQRLNVVD